MRKATLLYVEDDENDLLFLKRALEKSGSSFLLQHVGDGRAAMAYLSGSKPYADQEQFPVPDLVLLDINLPLVSGFEVLQWLRSQPRFHTLPVIIFSSSGRPEDRERARLLRADDYLIKPTSGAQFQEVVRQITKTRASNFTS